MESIISSRKRINFTFKEKLNRKIQIINTVYKSQDVKWDRHMMKYENWIAFQDWKEKN